MPLSDSPSASGLPTEWTHGTNSPLSPRTSRTFVPTRVITCMLITTYAESVSSTPIFAMFEPTGPIENGITYIVRPFMQPSYSPGMVFLSSFGSIQLLVGPAASLVSEAI